MLNFTADHNDQNIQFTQTKFMILVLARLGQTLPCSPWSDNEKVKKANKTVKELQKLKTNRSKDGSNRHK